LLDKREPRLITVPYFYLRCSSGNDELRIVFAGLQLIHRIRELGRAGFVTGAPEVDRGDSANGIEATDEAHWSVAKRVLLADEDRSVRLCLVEAVRQNRAACAIRSVILHGWKPTTTVGLTATAEL
jgi:hypothetical protein